MKALVIRTLVCVLLAATAAQAGITTANVKVLVTGRHCGELKDVFLVINGEDLEARWVKLDPDGSSCHWKADLGDGTISTSIATFSLRAGSMRSGCQKASADEAKLLANVEFSYSGARSFRTMSVKIEPPMRVSYVRYVHPFTEDRNPIPCREFATFEKGKGAINSATFEDEDVYFDFEPFKPKRPALGLLLNKIVVDDGTLLLTLDGVVFRLTVQRAKAQVRSAPTLSSNALSIDIKKLADLKFDHAEFQVIK